MPQAPKTTHTPEQVAEELAAKDPPVTPIFKDRKVNKNPGINRTITLLSKLRNPWGDRT